MEGNACYKFSTIRSFLALTGGRPVRVVVDVGANVGDVIRLAGDYFEGARIFGYEAVAEYARAARENTRDIPNVTISHRAVTAQHRFQDDLGARTRTTTLRVLRGQPEAGVGWVGGSRVVPGDDPVLAGRAAVPGYQLLDEEVVALTFDELVTEVRDATGAAEIDVVKMDCEGCEHSALGAASREALSRCRFIVGEYHGIERFYGVMEGKLYGTHKVSLVGDRELGAFFAERLDGSRDGILLFEKTGMLVARPWLADRPIDWNIFDERFVSPEERVWHGLPSAPR